MIERERALRACVCAASGCRYVALNEGFEGGGTRFWREGDSDDGYDHLPPPAIDALVPPVGCGVLFSGQTTHAGVKVESGVRHLLVMSFSLSLPEDCEVEGER